MVINASQADNVSKITIKTYKLNNSVYIEIKDNGCGIKEDCINSIFDPFYTTKDEGTGLGLSISYQIIKDHNGDISVDSKVGEGTTMTIRIPIAIPTFSL
jgi:two-component system, NtrC family, sensor kinase